METAETLRFHALSALLLTTTLLADKVRLLLELRDIVRTGLVA